MVILLGTQCRTADSKLKTNQPFNLNGIKKMNVSFFQIKIRMSLSVKPRLYQITLKSFLRMTALRTMRETVSESYRVKENYKKKKGSTF